MYLAKFDMTISNHIVTGFSAAQKKLYVYTNKIIEIKVKHIILTSESTY